jgi:nucleoid DNA-binding protein
MQTLLPAKIESKEDKKNRISSQKAAKAYRSEKLGRTRRGELKSDVELANIFRQLGIDFMSMPRAQAFAEVPKLWQGRKAYGLTKLVVDFLVDNYGAEIGPLDESGREVVLFPNPEGSTEMHLLDSVAKNMGVHRREAKKFYDCLCIEIEADLRTKREVHLPAIGRFYVKSIPAKPKRKGTDPSTGKRIWLEPKDASNKIRFSASKRLKTYTADLPVVLK